MTGNYNPGLGPAIRLETRTGLPGPKDIIDMVNETRRSKKRVELPFLPEGRPRPVVLTARFDERTAKMSWMLYDGVEDQSAVVWSALNPDPTKVVQAMRDWYTVARLAEGWEPSRAPKTQEYPKPDTSTPPTVTQTPPPGQPFPPTQTHPGFPPGFVTPPMTFPSLPYSGGYMAYPPGYPPQWPGYQPPYEPDPELLAQQWAQGLTTGSQAAFQPPVAPEQQSVQPAYVPPGAAPATGGLMLGDVLVAAGVIPTRTLQAALTLQNASQVTDRRQIGEILVSSGALPRNVLKAAVTLQDMARAGSITRNRMTDLLVRVHSTGASLDSLMHEAQKPAVASEALESAVSKRIRPSDERLEREAEVTDEEQRKLKNVIALLKRLDFKTEEAVAQAGRVLELLQKASLLKEESIDTSQKLADLVKTVLVKELVHPLTFEAAMSCDKLLTSDRLQMGQAIIALGYCDRGRIGLKDAIAEMGWDIDTSEL